MEWAEIFHLNVISFSEAAIRIALACLFGFVLGWERDAKNKPIDMQAYMIVSLTTCIVAIMGQELALEFSKNDGVVSLDLGKIIAGVLTGIGFLGAGALMKKGNDKLVGTATGASIWAAGAMGMCLGFGFYGLAIIAFILTTIILYCGKKIMQHMPKEEDGE